MSTAVEKILTEASETIPINKVKLYPKNPRRGNIDAIKESLQENGQFRPLVVQRSTGYILGGNHTYQAAKALGWKKISVVFIDVDDNAAKRVVLADNRTNDLATYDTDILAEVLKGLESPVGTGYSQEDYQALVDAVAENAIEDIESVLRPPMTINSPMGGDDDDEYVGEGRIAAAGGPTEDDEDVELRVKPSVDDDGEMLQDQLGELQGILQLREDMVFPAKNYYGIPDLVRSGIPDKLPTPLDTWAGEEATPDDGETWWVWNYGVAARKNLPAERAILCFYTHDHYFETFWDNPAFNTAKVLNAGIKYAVVPDFSFYSDVPVAVWVYNTFRAQWLGRYFQEAGLQVIPRLQHAIEKKDSVSLDFCMMGIPKNTPVLASSCHNMNSQDEFNVQIHNTTKCLEAIQPEQWLVYGGKPAQRMIDAIDPVKKGIVGEVVHIFNYAHKRRGVVFDKKEGLAAKRKDKSRMERDKTTEPDEMAPKPKGSRGKKGNGRADEEPEVDEFDE